MKFGSLFLDRSLGCSLGFGWSATSSLVASSTPKSCSLLGVYTLVIFLGLGGDGNSSTSVSATGRGGRNGFALREGSVEYDASLMLFLGREEGGDEKRGGGRELE